MNCFCLSEVENDECMVNCSGLHILHYSCLVEYIKRGKRQCPFDRQEITKCLHNGEVKNLPEPDPVEEVEDDLGGDYPCYICRSSTRPGRDFD
jgi:hypothetical protein